MHFAKYCKGKLSGDIEENPGPVNRLFVDSSKTISAPYSQGSVVIFGLNAGKQCVAMSLCSLIYNNKHGITTSNDLVSIMNIGNELYTRLSQSAGQSFLLQSELPTMLNVFETDYQLEYSESFSGTLHQETAIEGYSHCTSLQTAFLSLLSDDYANFILTIGAIAVAIFTCSDDDNRYKVLDSRARDLDGNSSSQGTCVLLELSSLSDLVHYFQHIHDNILFELKGINLNCNCSQSPTNNESDLRSHEKTFNYSYTIAIYSLCYSVIKSSSYWNLNTLSHIVDHGKQLCTTMNSRKENHIPDSVIVCNVDVGLKLHNTPVSGILMNTFESKHFLRQHIQSNCGYTGFVLSFISYSIGCILKPSKTSQYVYSLLVYDESKSNSAHFVKTINSINSLIDEIVTIHGQYLQNDYKIHFFSCLCDNVDVNGRKRLMKNQKERQKYDEMEPLKKRILLDNKKSTKKEKYKTLNKDKKQKVLKKNSERYRSMDSNKKRELLDKKAKKYRTMDINRKKDLLVKKAEKYRTIDTNRKKSLLEKNAEKYRTMDSNKKRELLDKNVEKYRTMDNNKKKDLLEKNAEKYRTMDNNRKKDFLEKKAEKYRTMDNNKKKELSEKNAEKYRKMDNNRKKDLSNQNAQRYKTMDKEKN